MNERAATRSPWLAPGVLIGALLPLAVLLWRAAHHTLGADPVALALNQLGLLALCLLLACLSATPLRLLFRVSWPMRLRRSLGLLAFFYACLHFATYLFIDQGFALAAVVADITERKFIAVGFIALCLLVPLAATSSRRMVQRLGSARWRRLHRLVYLAALLAVLHFVWRVKKDLTQPAIYAAYLGWLLWVRVQHGVKRRSVERLQ